MQERKTQMFVYRPVFQAVSVAIVILSCTLGGGVFIYGYAQRALIETVRQNLLSTAISAADLTDKIHIRHITSSAQKNLELYRDVQEPHIALLRAQPDLSFVYTMISGEGGRLFFVTDAQQDSRKVDDTADVMEPYDDTTPLMRATVEQGEPQVETVPSSDKWGDFLSAYAPLKNPDGTVFGLIGVDISLDRYNTKLSIIRRYLIFLGFISTLVSVVSGVFVWRVTRRNALHDRVKKSIADLHDVYVRRQGERTTALFSCLLESVLALTGSRCGFTARVLREGDSLSLRTFSSCFPEGTVSPSFFTTQLRPVEGVFREILAAGHPVFSDDPSFSLSQGAASELPCGKPCHDSYVGIPLMSGLEPMALIWIGGARRYDPETISLLSPLLGSFVSVLSSLRSEEALLHEKEYTDHILMQTPALIVGLSTDGITRFANPAVYLTTGYEEGEIIGRNWWDFIHPDEGKDQALALMDLFRSNTPVFDYEMILTTRKGEKRSISWTSLNRHDQGGELEEIILIGIDNTERNEFQGQLVFAKEDAEKANRAKTDFLAGMSHEIRTPMNGVLGTLELLSKTQLTDTQKKYIDVIRGSGRTLLEIINEILEYSKIESGSLRLHNAGFPLRETIGQQRDVLEPLALAKSITLEARIAENLPEYVFGDEIRIRQILTNITGNAIKFTPDGGRVRIILRPDEGREGHVLFEVSDTGIGIPRDKLDHIFAPFEQVIESRRHSKTAGTGLGLSICKHLVELMNGQIGVQSALGEGATFWFSLPLPAATAEQVHEIGVKKKEEEGGVAEKWAARVLVAEDVATNQFVIARMLESLGCTVEIAQNGKEAVEMIQKSSYDIVFMDCNMPIMDGFEATSLIKALPVSAPPIIALTANAFDEDREKCFSAGMDDFVSKPVEQKQIVRVLQSWTKRRGNHVHTS